MRFRTFILAESAKVAASVPEHRIHGVAHPYFYQVALLHGQRDSHDRDTHYQSPGEELE
jgi:hypothetical protein